MGEVVKSLNVKYYFIYTFIILFTFIGYFLNYSNYIQISLHDTYVRTLPIIVVVISAIFIVFGFSFFEIKKKSIARIEDKWMQSRTYIRFAGYRLYCIGACILIGIPVFYITMNSIILYSIGVAAIALLFCKPSENKVQNDLNIHM
jgi:hypothetical protein